MIRGSCLCQGIRLEIRGKPLRASHCFVGSKAPWVEIADSLPQHDGRAPPG